MTATAHAMTGVAIAAVIKKPKWAIPLAFLSHLVCDAIPHFGLGMDFGSTAMYAWLLIDGLVLISLFIFLYYKKVPNFKLLVICAIVAMSPDFAWLFYGLKGIGGQYALMDPFTQFHAMIQWSESAPGIIVDIAWISAMLAITLEASGESYENTATAEAKR